jgi:hypothetical protein
VNVASLGLGQRSGSRSVWTLAWQRTLQLPTALAEAGMAIRARGVLEALRTMGMVDVRISRSLWVPMDLWIRSLHDATIPLLGILVNQQHEVRKHVVA